MRSAVAAAKGRIVVTGRTDNFIQGRPDLDDTIRRLTAFAEVGADVLYAPYPPDLDALVAIVTAVAPTPVNVLISPADQVLTVAELRRSGSSASAWALRSTPTRWAPSKRRPAALMRWRPRLGDDRHQLRAGGRTPRPQNAWPDQPTFTIYYSSHSHPTTKDDDMDLDKLMNKHLTRYFDGSKTIPEETLQQLLRFLRSAPRR